ncbi:MAG: HAD family phosphatase, partial [Acidobacteria bacterium]|nr:HAD family phosphatase [Acidobacteriota bacterium]
MTARGAGAATLAGVIFDFDGVLADSEPLHLRAYQDVLAERGMTLGAADYYDRYLGFDDDGVFRTVCRDQGLVLDDETLAGLIRVKGERFEALAGQGEALFPGAADCIRRVAAEAPIAIASGALAPEIETVLAAADLRRHFRAVVASGDTPTSKPAPDPYLRALELLRPHIAASAPARRGRDRANAVGGAGEQPRALSRQRLEPLSLDPNELGQRVLVELP